MRREEAVNRFKGIRESFSIGIAQSKFYPSKAELNELCDMAIEALSAKAVSRKDTVTLNSPISIQADMVAVVRCKDCRYRKKVGTSYYCKLDEFNVKDADFCSWGERREE